MRLHNLRIFNIVFILIYALVANAGEYYCWSIAGLNIRDTPSPQGNIIGKLIYGQKVNIAKSNEELESFSDPFLPGENNKHGGISFQGNWVKVVIDSLSGYVFDGYLSRYPIFKIKITADDILTESLDRYMYQNYKLFNYSKSKWDSSFRNKIEVPFMWEKGVTIINYSDEIWAGATLFFSDMTFNEALLFVKFNFSIFDKERISMQKRLEEGEGYYLISASEDGYEINFPAPDGKIKIIQIGASIIISYHGSC